MEPPLYCGSLKISLNLNIPVPESREGGSMLWHKDDFGYKSLDLFLPINEVTENNGPLCYVEKKNQLGVFHKIKKATQLRVAFLFPS